MRLSNNDIDAKVARRIVLRNQFVLARKSCGHEIYKRGNETIVLPSGRLCAMIWRRLCKTHRLKI